MSEDIADLSGDILFEWTDAYADLMRDAGGNTLFRSQDDAIQSLFTAFVEGLAETSDIRLSLPLGQLTPQNPSPSQRDRRSNPCAM